MFLDDQKYIDITEELFASVSRCPNKSNVVKSSYFDLLEGTRAIEALNTKLDTGLIELSAEDLSFDSASPQSIEEVIVIQNKLILMFLSWLNNSSLPVTVLSCRYVQTLLTNYMSNKSSTMSLFDMCSFVNPRLPKTDTPYVESPEYSLVHIVLKSFTIGLCRFIGLSLNIASNVLYEEEDLTTRNMNLDFLYNVSAEDTIHELKRAIHWIQCQDFPQAKTLIHQLNLIIFLNKSESVLSLSMPVFEKSASDLPIEFLNDAIDSIEYLEEQTYTTALPPGSFSKFIQLDLDNKVIPLELYEIPQKDSWDNLKNIFSTLHSFVSKSYKLENCNRLINFLKFDIGADIANTNVLARGFFQLYLVRDDKSIFGSTKTNIGGLSIDFVENIIGVNSQVFNPSSFANLKPEVQTSADSKLQQLMQDLEAAIYHNLTIPANNVCRQQQLTSKGLLVWDNLQVSWEAFEVEIFQLFRIGDELPNGDLGLSVSSYVYYTKLNLMIELLLNGFNLQLYKPFEYYLIYWYASYLYSLQVEHVQGRIIPILQAKINYIEKSFPKKIKKLKAGPKKEQLKVIHQHNTTVALPSLTQQLNYTTLFLVPTLQATSDLVESTRTYLLVLSSLGLIDFLSGPKNSVTSFEFLFKQRLKPWSSIGVPQLPEFQHFKSSLHFASIRSQTLNSKPLLKGILDKLLKSKETFQQILKDITHNELIQSQFFQNDNQAMISWYNDLIKTGINLSIEIKNLIKSIDDKIPLHDYRIDISDGYHRYFPKVCLTKNS